MFGPLWIQSRFALVDDGCNREGLRVPVKHRFTLRIGIGPHGTLSTRIARFWLGQWIHIESEWLASSEHRYT
ncbi:unnamed protein product [Clonostachys solani]|uniref:Uncharacterized protein n=1 Tax=Clonostachys solani TaxID=160281 RepID=A0A9N9Z2I0_9HYPO|nr:unnamed protein product [Clonostachys solani]